MSALLAEAQLSGPQKLESVRRVLRQARYPQLSTYEQRFQEVHADLTRAKSLADEFNIPIQQAIVLLNPPTPNGNLPMGTNSQTGAFPKKPAGGIAIPA